MSVVVGVDIGSSAARAVAIERNGIVLAHTSSRYDGVESWPVGHANPRSWALAIQRAIAELAMLVPEAKQPAAVGIGGQSPTTVSADSSIALTYQHSTDAEGDFDGQHQAQRSVIEHQHPGIAVSQAWDWALMQLGAPHVQGLWPGFEALNGFGDAVATGEVVGYANGEWGVGEGALLVPGAPDAVLTCWAAGLDEMGRACDPGGRTGGLFVAASSSVAPVFGVFGMKSPAQGVSILGGPVSGHGRALEWLSGITNRSIETLLLMAEDAPLGSGGVVFLPYLAGERTPRWRSDLRGEFIGLSLDTGPGEMARAVIEGSAYGLAHIAHLLTESEAPIATVTSTGSPSLSRLWCEIKASVMGVPLEVSDFTELSAYGGALAAGAGAGWWPAPGTAGTGSWPRLPMTVVQPTRTAEYRPLLRQFISLGDIAEQRNDSGDRR